MTPADWLTAKSRTYWDDAVSLERMPEFAAGGMDGEQWAVVYRAVCEELRKCSTDIEGETA